MTPLLLLLAAASLLADGTAAGAHSPAHHARANLASYVTDADYPADAIRRQEQGTVGFTLDVDEAGRVSACRITQSSGTAALDEATCRIMRERAGFSPAVNRRGRPVPDHVSSRIHWVLPEPDTSRALANLASYVADDDYPAEALRRGEQGIVGFQLEIGPDGLVSGCEVLSSSGSSALDEATCSIMQARARFSPARDGAGRAVADRVQARLRWVLPVEEPEPGAPGGADFGRYISSADYPAEALRRHEEGEVGVRLSISTLGGVAQCVVTRSSGSAALDARSCELLRLRVVYIAPLDEAGHAVPSVVEGSIHWTLPGP
jgi:TonB family protein